jgi:hypothetical protein
MSNDDEEEEVIKKIKIPKYTLYFSDMDPKNVAKILECKHKIT